MKSLALLYARMLAWWRFHEWQMERLRLEWAQQRMTDALAKYEQANLCQSQAVKREQRASEISAAAFQERRAAELRASKIYR